MAGLLAVSVAAAGCTASEGANVPAGMQVTGASQTPSPSPTPESVATVTSNVPSGSRGVHVDKVVKLTADKGTLDKVRVTVGKSEKTLPGKLSGDQTSWTASARLEPGHAYRVHAVAVDSKGLKTVDNHVFRTQNLTLDQQTYPSIAPLQGETVGVGMPVILHFDVAVHNKKAFEKHLSVTSTPKQVGAWHWISDNEVHWRPKTYWKPGTDVTVHADVNSVPAGNGVYGQMSRTTTFHVGDSIISKVDVLSHQMKVYINGKLARTVSISAGKPGFITRSGIKVVIEKERHKQMDAATIGIPKNSPEYYNLDVEYAMRVTYSGEFLHAAPWSASAQGIANTSHGCVGMSEANAAWLFNMTKRGDVVAVTGSDRHMTLTNGYGDWNESFAQYKQGSALS
jgi:lipoprotein-anchoring transpeptidase ErfK/SrfK